MQRLYFLLAFMPIHELTFVSVFHFICLLVTPSVCLLSSCLWRVVQRLYFPLTNVPIHALTFVSVFHFICLFVTPSVCLFVCLSEEGNATPLLSSCIYVNPCINFYLRLSFHLSLCYSFSLSVCLRRAMKRLYFLFACMPIHAITYDSVLYFICRFVFHLSVCYSLVFVRRSIGCIWTISRERPNF